MTPRDVLKLAEQKKVQFIDLRFMDFPGLWQHTTLPDQRADARQLRPRLRLRRLLHPRVAGDQRIGHAAGPGRRHRQDRPVPAAHDAVDHLRRARPDHQEGILAATRARSPARPSTYLKKTKIADTAYFGPELEFFIFDHAWYDQGINFAKYYVGSREGIWGRGDEDATNLGYKIRLKEGYFPTPPMDTMQNIRSEMVATLIDLGIPVEAHHHEVATGGQCEIDMRYQDLMTMADSVMMYKYVCKNVAARHGKVVTFMPKPLFQDNGSGMHVHFSPVEGRQAAVRREQVRGPERDGPVRDRRDPASTPRALCALCNPTTNSYKRLVPGYEAPVNLVYSSRNRSAAIRIPMYSENPKTKRIEFRCPDSSLQPLPRLQRHDDGRDRRDPEQDRPRRPDGQGHLPPHARGVREDRLRPRLRWTRRWTSWRTTTTSCSRATSSPPT